MRPRVAGARWPRPQLLVTRLLRRRQLRRDLAAQVGQDAFARLGALVVGNAAQRGEAGRASASTASTFSVCSAVSANSATRRSRSSPQGARLRRPRWRTRRGRRRAADAPPAAAAGSTPAMRTRNAALGTFESAVARVDDHAHVGPSCRAAGVARVVERNDDGVGHDVLRRNGGLADLVDLALERAPGSASRVNVTLARPHARDVGFVDPTPRPACPTGCAR